MDKEPKDPETDLNEIISFFKSPEWRHWVDFLKKRQINLQQEVNTAVGHGDIVKAQIALHSMKDCRKQIELFGLRVSEAERLLRREK